MIKSRKVLGSLVLLIAAIWTVSLLHRGDLEIPISLSHHAPASTTATAAAAAAAATTTTTTTSSPATTIPDIGRPDSDTSHPIDRLVSKAREEFQTKLNRQSRTLQDAVAEYRRRYQMPPPPNFDKWYEFAKGRGVKMIDEYDSIYHSLLPFWALEPAVIRERVRQTIGFDNAMIAVLIRGGKVTKTEGGGEGYAWHREATPVMLGSFIKYLPDMDLAFNIHDEPRIVMQHDNLQMHVEVARTQNIPKVFEKSKLKNSFSASPKDLGKGDRIKEYKTTRFNVFAHQPTWSNSRISCPLDSAARNCLNDSCPDNVAAYSTLPLGLIENTTAFSDICNSPSFEYTFGFFDRPNAFDVAHELIPVFSQSKVSSFQDILYPSPWYYMDRVKYDPSLDFPWSEKKPNMYWRGSTTGGFSRDGGWRRQHRQRFLTKIQPVGTASVLHYNTSQPAPDPASNTTASPWTEHQTPMADFADYFDVRFTYIGQCDPGDCDAQREFFPLADPVNMFDALASRHLLDIDGNAFSGRYHAWLQSNSLVYKLALFREWHDDWLCPWHHFVPLGLDGAEVVEALRYFDRDPRGRDQAERIAAQSKEWAHKVLRHQDIEVWYFRLLLEYGRLVDDDRYNIGFTP